MRLWHVGAFLGLLIVCSLPSNTWAISASQTDDFENGTTLSWTDGSGGANVANITTGGPAGANDNYLQISSGSFCGSARLVTFNQSQWVGNYAGAGVSQIAMDLKNLGSSTIPIRIAIREGTGGSGTPGYASTTGFSLPADGLWHHAIFALTAGTMTPINSPQPFATDLASVQDFRLLSSTAPSLVGDSISARVGVDNITTVVPEPGALMAASLLLAARFMSRRSSLAK